MKSDVPSPGSGPIVRDDGSVEPATRQLMAFAAAAASGDERAIRAEAAGLAALAPPATWVDELLLQSVLMLGYPLALVATDIWRRESGQEAPGQDSSAQETLTDWERRGIETCRRIYGASYERLRANVRALHPALDRAMVVEGYGRVLSRPGLDLARRELCTIAQIAVLGTPRQLHSHLRGALNAGAGSAAVDAALLAADPYLSPAARRIARDTWAEVRGAG